MRAAAKNHARVTILCDPQDYDKVAKEIESSPTGDTDENTKFVFMKKNLIIIKQQISL